MVKIVRSMNFGILINDKEGNYEANLPSEK